MMYNTVRTRLVLRLTSGPGLEARWSCPKYKEYGCPATFSARIAVCEDEESGDETR